MNARPYLVGAAAIAALSMVPAMMRAQVTNPAKQPGAVGDVAGHVPDQNEQAQRAPITPSNAGKQPFDSWWSPGEGRRLPETIDYDDPYGKVGLYNASGPIETKGHPFFEAIGKNGRACVSCHQPSDAMSLSVATIQKRWADTGGKDPIFAAIDGQNCPSLPPGDPASHSLLLKRGLFRIFLPWPPKARDGKPIDPEFDIEVVRDPTGCNLSPVYGIKSSDPMVSIYRRPRPLINMKYPTQDRFGAGEFIGKTGMPASRDPDTNRPVSMNLMSDARHPTLKTQAVEAAVTHLQYGGKPTDAEIAGIVAFEKQIYGAQVQRTGAGSLIEKDGPPSFGPRNLAKGEAGVLGNNTTRWIFPMGDAWKGPQKKEEAEMRASIRRGHDIFMFRTFWIRDSMHLNTVGLGNPTKRTCATCHGMHMTGMDSAAGWMDIGTTNLPWAKEAPRNPWTNERPELPLFRITCKKGVPPHPYLGRVFYTQDPGRALISGKCNDVGTIVMQQFRGLAARAPYFSNGSAASIRELIDFYDRRYDIGFSEADKTDLEHFLSSL